MFLKICTNNRFFVMNGIFLFFNKNQQLNRSAANASDVILLKAFKDTEYDLIEAKNKLLCTACLFQ